MSPAIDFRKFDVPMTWTQSTDEPIDNRIGLSSAFARDKASSPPGIPLHWILRMLRR